MMQIAHHNKARKDVMREVKFLIEFDVDAALATFDLIDDAVSVLKNYPKSADLQ